MVQVTVQTGDLLGEWTDELNGDHIVSWARNPIIKYKTSSGKEVTKVKGFTLHHRNAEKTNAQVLERLIDGELQSVQVTNQQITRDVKTKNLVNKMETKTLKF